MQQVLSRAAGVVSSLGLSFGRQTAMGCVLFSSLAGAVTLISAMEPQTALAQLSANGTITLRMMDVADPRLVPATVESLRETALRSPVAGTVTGLALSEGDRLKAGDPVAVVIDARLLPRQRTIEARARSAAAEQRRAELELDRASRLKASGSGTQQRFEDARVALDIATAQIAALKAEMALIDAERADGVITAPSDGVLRRIDRPNGSQVQGGEAIVQFAPDRRILRLRLPERHAALLKDGDELVVHPPQPVTSLPATSSQPMRARVLRIHPGLENGALLVDAALDGLGTLRLGQSLHVSVTLGTRSALAVPLRAVQRRNGMEFVRLASGQDVPVRTGGPVHPLVQDDMQWLEVLSGLRDGDAIILSPDPPNSTGPVTASEALQ